LLAKILSNVLYKYKSQWKEAKDNCKSNKM